MSRHVLGDRAAARLRELLTDHAGRGAEGGDGVEAGVQMVRVSGPESEDAPGFWPCVPSDYVTSEAVFDEDDSQGGDPLEEGLLYAPNGPLVEGNHYLAVPADDQTGGDLSVSVWVTDGREFTEGFTLAEVDGTPSYAGVLVLTVDQADGLKLTQPGGPGTARLDILPADAIQAGVVSTGAQVFAGVKSFGNSTWTGDNIYLNGNKALVCGPSTPALAGGRSSFGGNSIGTGGGYTLGQAFMAALKTDGTDPGTGAYATILLDGNGLTLSDETGAAACYKITRVSTVYAGADGTSGGGDTVKGGIITTIGTGPVLPPVAPSAFLFGGM